MTERPWFVFAGGGTGGHLFPALAVTEWLEVGSAADVTFFCTQRPIDADILGRSGLDAQPLSVLPFPSRPWNIPRFWLRWRESVALCMRRFAERRPAVVVGAGGYASGPPVHAALRMGIPAFLLNPDAVPGRANRHFARDKRLTGVFSQWEVTREHLPAGAPVVVTGCPVRSDFLSVRPGPTGIEAHGGRAWAGLVRIEQQVPVCDARQARLSFGLDPDRPTLLVTGASQGARTINEAILLLGKTIGAAEWQVLHLSGAADREQVTRGYAAAGVRAVVLAFTDRMPDAMAACDLIVSRAGASSLAEILAIGKPSVLLPYPFHRDRHQWHNGAVLVKAGAAIMLEDHKDAPANARELGLVLGSLLRDDRCRREMGASARTLGRPGAARVIAQVLASASSAPRGSLFRLDGMETGEISLKTARCESRACA